MYRVCRWMTISCRHCFESPREWIEEKRLFVLVASYDIQLMPLESTRDCLVLEHLGAVVPNVLCGQTRRDHTETMNHGCGYRRVSSLIGSVTIGYNYRFQRITKVSGRVRKCAYCQKSVSLDGE